MSDYKKTVHLKHHESILVVDKRTGDITQDKTKKSPGNSTMSYHNKDVKFSKTFNPGLQYARIYFTVEERGVILTMIEMAKPYTNAMPPLTKETSLREIGRIFDIPRHKVKKIFEKLFKHGVYYTYKITEFGTEENSYWVLNPDIAFNGRLISKSLQAQFENTLISQYVKSQKNGK